LSTKSIFLTGSFGFVGLNLIDFFNNEYSIVNYSKNTPILINETIVIHLAGKAHDLKKVSNPEEYYQNNTDLTKKVFDAFMDSDAKVFITLSSVKSVADQVLGDLTEDNIANPITHYGKSKLLAEQYILSKIIPVGKRVYILRPCMIHGPGNKGNLNFLYNFVSVGIPWPLGAYENKRSFCSIDNLIFIIKELIERDDIPSGIYNVADDIPLSTNDLISILAESQQKKSSIWHVSKCLIQFVAKMGNVFKLPLNEERLQKLTESYVVSNKKLLLALGKPLPISSKEGLMKTFRSFLKG
jgi:nucleoside-diphosphate-sugar epimerase